jgi:hypothetical protein
MIVTYLVSIYIRITIDCAEELFFCLFCSSNLHEQSLFLILFEFYYISFQFSEWMIVFLRLKRFSIVRTSCHSRNNYGSYWDPIEGFRRHKANCRTLSLDIQHQFQELQTITRIYSDHALFHEKYAQTYAFLWNSIDYKDSNE